jgi:hypothetical protein
LKVLYKIEKRNLPCSKIGIGNGQEKKESIYFCINYFIYLDIYIYHGYFPMQSNSYQIVKVKTCPECGSRRINRRARIKGYVCRPVGYTCKECRSNFISPAFKEVRRSTVSTPFYLKNKRYKATKTE